MKRMSVLVVGLFMGLFTLAGIAYAGQGQVNINTATAEELQLLPGIGESTAMNIIEFRKINGTFSSVDDLVKVKGIGDAKLKKLRNYLKVEGKTDFDPTSGIPKGDKTSAQQ